MHLDIIVLIIIVLGILFGLKNGIFVEIISVFGFVLNLIIAKMYTPVILNFFRKEEIFSSSNYFITYAVTFLGVYAVMGIILNFIKKALRTQNKGFFDRLIGGIIGGVKGLILAVILLVVYVNIIDFIPSLEKYSNNSKSIEYMSEAMPNFDKYIPKYFIEKFNLIRNRQIINNKI